MSDLHAWPATAAVEAALGELHAYRDQLRGLVHEHDRDDPRRELLDAVWGSLEQVEERMRRLLTEPARVVGVPRVHGEETQEWLIGQAPSMRRNRGQWTR